MFTGEFQHTLDEKGRVIIPAKLREGLGDVIMITRGLDRCLFIYPLEAWKKIEQKLKELPLTRSEARAFARYFFSGAAEVEIDKQGRILIPQNLREYAGIEKEVAIIGVSDRVEVWSEAAWREYTSAENLNFEAVAEKLADFVF
ncbi:MAG: division/cell wall cluster transcriptional repressor MraZ [Firmicutes bacterium]|jgi:MraZ protein|nr:division/cell wall cluster transcriptional repressor MraZ [Bacillota bacterium]HPU00841.1 division/cell wall cluster transcriptional repressor MraZ [Bacillota bacterium]